ncbi:MAG: DUF4097 family beta strand repeat protein [Eubacteriales bacterium]|nr:DUF4097 family beta strand repeat protein [Eubacteriales bacterium]
MKKGILIAGLVLVAVGSVLLLGALIGSGFNLTKFETGGTKTAVYPVDRPFSRIEITEYESNVQLLPSADGSAGVVYTGNEKVSYTVSVEDGTLKIRAEDNRAWYERWGLFRATPSTAVYLPADQYDALIVYGRTGTVFIPERFTFGTVFINVTTGNIICRASANDSLTIRGKSGNVNLENARAGSVNLTTSTGRITVCSVVCKGEFSTRCTTGDTSLVDLTCQSLLSNVSTGSVILQNTVAADSFLIQGGTGSVVLDDCDAGRITVKVSTGDVTGTLRTAKIFYAHTSTGRVRVPDTNSGGRCEITTSTGDVTFRIAGD